MNLDLKEINHEFLLIVDSEIIFSESEVEQMISCLITFEDFGMITPNTVQNVRDHFVKGLSSQTASSGPEH